MGDRCWLGLRLHGDIEDPRALVGALRAIIKENLCDEWESGNDTSVRSFIEMLVEDPASQFVGYEVNYGNIDDCEEALQDWKVSYSVDHAEGGDYAAASWTWTADEGKYEAITSHGDLMLTVSEVKAALDAGGCDAIQRLIDDTEKAEGKQLPPLTFSGRAERMVARVMGLKALKAAE